MKTTLDPPDELMRADKIRAVEEHGRPTGMITDHLRRGLAQQPGVPPVRQRARLPLAQGAHGARPGKNAPEQVAEVLIEEEA